MGLASLSLLHGYFLPRHLRILILDTSLLLRPRCEHDNHHTLRVNAVVQDLHGLHIIRDGFVCSYGSIGDSQDTLWDLFRMAA